MLRSVVTLINLLSHLIILLWSFHVEIEIHYTCSSSISGLNGNKISAWWGLGNTDLFTWSSLEIKFAFDKLVNELISKNKSPSIMIIHIYDKFMICYYLNI